MASKQTAEELKDMAGSIIGELDTYIVKGTKASAKRARKLTLDFEKKAKIFRKESVQDSKA